MLSEAEARALITTSLSTSELEDVIAREEEWLARRIGPLEGERLETFVTQDGDEVLRLTRPTTEATVEDDSGDREDWELRGWSDIVPSGSWRGDVRVGYTPSDALEVKRVLITLVRLTVNESAYASQSAGGYAVAVDTQSVRTVRYAAWRSLLRQRAPSTTRLRSTIPFGGKSLGAVAVEPLLGS